MAFAAGIIAVALSLAMLPLDPRGWANIAVRDLGQVYLVGFLFPLIYIRRTGGDFADFGFSLRRWPLFRHQRRAGGRPVLPDAPRHAAAG